MNLPKILLPIAAFTLSFPSWAQGTLEDYNRAYALPAKYNHGYVPNARIAPQWIAGTDKFWYVDENQNGSRLYTLVDASKQKSSPLFDAKKLASEIEAKCLSNPNPRDIRLENLNVSANLDTLWFNRDGRMWTYIKSGKHHLIDRGEVPVPPEQPHWMVVDEEKEFPPVPSPDGTKVAFVRDHNLCVRDVATGQVTQLTTDGTIGNYYSSYIYWSPDSKKFAVNKIRPVEKRYVYYVESSPAQGSQPILHKQEYAKPGDELRFKLPVIADVEKAVVIQPETTLFNHQYDLWGLMWNSESEAVTFEYIQGRHDLRAHPRRRVPRGGGHPSRAGADHRGPGARRAARQGLRQPARRQRDPGLPPGRQERLPVQADRPGPVRHRPDGVRPYRPR